ncbi:MAG: hypothetical protein DWQ47_17675 [Acidobacteria bacterium]|nr:MAG: hypothetical protein DWQ32_05075 [Acidobacteriota bacterium]REK02132.1 MAG: hypothetical protein DWQ38_07080 [Acidobacteriota bacterium]REK14066.1 MAG: hypothetical protein DWQ43_10765 [Acidobacteriota bacterium]REK42061.1 MAG: hypothetical protein DWQ47_17675 [Acidobacteriota bacterium]
MRKFIFAIAAIGIFAASVFAQTTTGRLLGNVSGPDGLLPGATVTLTDNQTGRTLTTVANDSGAYRFENVTFGTYTVRVNSDGFKTFIANDVKIDANREYTLNPVLEIGDVNIEVTVQAGADVVNASNAELSTTVSPKQVLDLPINGRNPLGLLNLQAGVNPTSNSINGQRSSSVNYTRDGVNVQDNFIRTGGFVQDRPTVDDTGEFTVTTQNSGAELGNGGSTQVQLVTPRGGSDFHGAGFLYNRNSEFAANTFGNNATGVARPFLNRNQFGGKIGGPLPIPGFGQGTPAFFKDKGFFFVAYERFVLRQTSPNTNRVLLAPFRDGSFSYVRADNGMVQNVNILSGAGLNLGSQANVDLFNAAGGSLGVDPTIMSRFLSNTPTSGNSNLQNILSTGDAVTQNITNNQSNNTLRNSLTMRFDVDINASNSVYFIHKWNDDFNDRPDADAGFGTSPFATQTATTRFFSGNWTTILGSNFTNSFTAAYVAADPFFNEASSFPTDYLIGGLPLGLTTPEPVFQDQGRDTEQVTLRNDSSYTLSDHTFRFGFESNFQNFLSQTNFNKVPIYTISTTGNPNTPQLDPALFPGGISGTDRSIANSLRYLLGGIVGAGTVQSNFVDAQTGAQIGATAFKKYEYGTHGLYFNDQWRVTPELTLNLGVRWDYHSPLENPSQVYLEPDLQGADSIEEVRQALLDPNGQLVLLGNNAGKPGRFTKPDLDNFAPVLGFAYSSIDGKGILGSILGRNGVLRGGFRMSYINDEYVQSLENAGQANDGLNFTVPALQNGSASLNARFNNLPGFVSPQPQIPFSFAAANAADGFFTNTIFVADPNLQTQRNMEYNIGIQREIGLDTVVEIRYVGGRSDDLWRGIDFNQVNINAGGFLNDFQTARNNCRIAIANFNTNNPNLPIRTMDQGCSSAEMLGTAMLPGQATVGPTVNGLLGFGIIRDYIQRGIVGEMAQLYITNGLDGFGGANFRANPNGGNIDLLFNSGRYRYNALQFEVRRRFSDGLSFQGNYTFQKILADVPNDTQARFQAYLDLNNPQWEYSRADYDRKHTININANYELPFGNGKPFLNQGGWVDTVLGGWQLTSIVNISSGPPISIKDINGTLNRTGRSNRQTANSSLSPQQIDDLIGIFHQNGVIYFIDPSVIGPNGSATNGNLEGTPNANFPGQVFFRAQPGQTGTLPRAFIDGPWYFNWDAGLLKNFRFGEKVNVQFRAEAFNLLNQTNFRIAENTATFDIDSTTFGQIPLANTYAPRIMQFALRVEF